MTVPKKEKFEVKSKKPYADLHAKWDLRLHCTLKTAVRELGYTTIASWARSAAMNTIREWEQMKMERESRAVKKQQGRIQETSKKEASNEPP